MRTTIFQKQMEIISWAVSTRRDALGIVLLATIVQTNSGFVNPGLFIASFLVPDCAWMISLIGGRIGRRIFLESTVLLYPSLLLGLGLAQPTDTWESVFVAIGTGWILRLGIQRLINPDILAMSSAHR